MPATKSAWEKLMLNNDYMINIRKHRSLVFIIMFSSTLFLLDALFPVSLNPSRHFAKVITAEDGTPLRSFADKNGIWRYPITIEQVSQLYIEALINYEDRWFWQHPGINPLSICRALIQNIKNNRIVSGGSTITMQVARLISPHSRTVTGKIKQIFTALQLEWHYSKKQILTYYLNHAPFGGTIEGVQAASYTYLGKSAQELSHAEAALLTILPQAPSRNRPDRHPDRALIVRNKVLLRLATQSVWTESVINQALLEPIVAQHNLQPIIAPLLARRLKSQFPEKTVIKTTIDYDMQLGIETLIRQYIEQLPEKTSAAVLVVENQSLKVKTYVGSAIFLDQNRFGHIDMIQAIRSPGSTLKPFLYGIAIDQGLIHSKSLLTDAPLSFDGYKPQNFSKGFTGPVSVNHALKRSLNIPAIQVLHHLTPEVFVSTLKNAGLMLVFNSMAKSNLSVILGGVGSNLETLVGTYTAFVNGGQTGQIRFLSNSPVKQRYLFSPGSAWIINNILSDQNTLSLNNLSWKTGTSYGHRDFWSIGVTPSYTIGVWIGRPDGTPLPGHYGSNTASPLLFTIAEKLPQLSLIKKPETVTEQSICWPLGSLESDTQSDLCHERKQAWILGNNTPLTLSNHNKSQWEANPITIQTNAKTGHAINNTCDAEQTKIKQIALWPLAVEPWIAENYRRKKQIGIFDASCKKQIVYTANEIKIEGLENNTKLRSAGASKILPRIKLQAKGGQGEIYWFINAHLIYTVSNSRPIFHQFEAAGNYQITVIDDAGHSDSITLKVL